MNASETAILLQNLIRMMDETKLVLQQVAPCCSLTEHKAVCQSVPNNNTKCSLYTVSFFTCGDMMRSVGTDGIVDMMKLGSPYMHWSSIVSFSSLDASLNPLRLDGMFGTDAQLVLEQILVTNVKTKRQFVTDAAKLQNEECKLGMVLVYLKDLLAGLKQAETAKFDIFIIVEAK